MIVDNGFGRRRCTAVVALLMLAPTGCAFTDNPSAGWTGTIDTLASGQVVVTNPEAPIWTAEQGWRVVEELRLGSIDSNGPDMFGNIGAFAVDDLGRVWVLDSQSQELRVFAPDGGHVRTIGRKGGGPGEFAQAVRVEQGPGGHMWVMDPQNNRFSVFDTAGTYLDSKPARGGFIIMPWPGRFDAAGNYYAPIPRMNGGVFSMALLRYDTAFVPQDTIMPPEDPVERDYFDFTSDKGRSRMRTGIPYSGGIEWTLTEAGTFIALVTDQYRIFEVNTAGDTLRTLTRTFSPVPVTDEDVERARESVEWFTKQGGKVDMSKLPDTKPPVVGFFVDDERNLWVVRTPDGEASATTYDIFDPGGRFLGTVQVPFQLAESPVPIVRDGVLWGVTSDELEVEYVVRARVDKPAA